MASEIKVDTIVNAGGDNDTGIDLATNDQILLKVANATRLTMNSTGQTTIVGEGGTTTTNLQQGLNKFWNNVDADASSIATRDSFNQSSIADGGTGDYVFVFTNNMANNDYSHTTGANSASGHLSMIYSEGEMNTSQTRSYVVEIYANNPTDSDVVVNTVAGDLA